MRNGRAVGVGDGNAVGVAVGARTGSGAERGVGVGASKDGGKRGPPCRERRIPRRTTALADRVRGADFLAAVFEAVRKGAATENSDAASQRLKHKTAKHRNHKFIIKVL